MLLTPHHIRLLKRLLLLLVPYSLLRIGFYFFHLNIYGHFSKSEIFESLALGIRFDVAAVILINIPVIILAFIPSYNKRFIKLERYLFIFLNSIAFIAGVDDYELFSFIGKRLSYDFFVINSDIFEQLPQLVVNYWYMPFIAILFNIVFYFFDAKCLLLDHKKISWFSHLSSILLAGFMFIGIRGGLQHKSINVQSAFVQGKNELGHLVLNTPYHFLRTLNQASMKKLNHFISDNDAKEIIRNQRDFSSTHKGKSKANIVLIILESFSSEYLEKGYAPFLVELSKKSIFNSKHLANGRRSIESLPSILCGLPSLLQEPISKSIYSSNKFPCFPRFLKNEGYTNYFFHAGAKGTMGFDAYTLANGFDKYFSRDEYGKKDFDGTWGVFDFPYLQYVVDELDQTKEPFLAGIFTLSSHQPYAIPDTFQGKFPKGTLEIHESIGYTDYALRKFFEKAEKSKWFHNTIFIITSDHSQKLETKKYLNMVGHYRVPLILSSPGLMPRNLNKVTQHSDIPKTILDLLDIEGELPGTSVSAFSNDPGMAINFADGTTYFLAKTDRIQTIDTEFAYDWGTGEMTSIGENKDPLLKAYLQYFMNGLINNNLSVFQ